MGNCRGYNGFGFNGNILIIDFINDNCLNFQKILIIEKRIAITPEIAKKYISLGFRSIVMPENYATHLGIKDRTIFTSRCNNSLKMKKKLLINADIMVQLSLPTDEKNSSNKRK